MNRKNRKGKCSSNKYSNEIKKETDETFINLDDSESEIEKITHQNKKISRNKYNEKRKNKKLLGNKHKSNFDQGSQGIKSEEYIIEYNNKRPKLCNDNNSFKSPKKDILSNNTNKQKTIQKIKQNKNEKKINKIKNLNIKNEEKEEEEMIEFPYEFTERIIEAMSCEYCGGIYIRPHLINVNSCEHIFCLGCIMKMLENKEIGECFKCKIQFGQKDIKYSEITDFYVKTFFPQIPQIIEENISFLNKFMETEAKKYAKIQNKKIVICGELRPFKENIPPENRLSTIMERYNKIVIDVDSEDYNVIGFVKKQIIKRLNLALKEEEIEVRIQGIEVSQIKTFKLLKSFLSSNFQEIFFYSKKGLK